MAASQSINQFSAPNCQTLHQTLNEFRLTNTLCDVIIMDDLSHTTSAHSCILAAASPVLKSTIMLKDSNRMLIGQGVTLMIGGISVEVWKLLLEYLYLNTLVIPAVPGLLEDILVAANMLGMKDLINLINNHVESAGIVLGPTRDICSLKITLAPTRPVNQENKAVQTNEGDTDGLTAGVRVVESTGYLKAASFHQAPQQLVSKAQVFHQAPHQLVSKAQVFHQAQQHVVSPQPVLYQQEVASDQDVTTQMFLQAVTTQRVPQETIDQALAVHEAYNVHVAKPLRCRFCKMDFDRKGNLVEHVADWCVKLNKPFLPSDVKPTQVELMKYSLSVPHNEGQGKIYRCINPECGQLFKTSTSLRKHAWSCILGADTFKPIEMVCELTDGTIIFKDDNLVTGLEDGAILQPLAYLDEKTKDASLKARLYNCAHCNFTAKRERIADHLAVHHGKRRPFSCKVCGLRYGYYDSLRDHYVGVHTSAQFNCTVCGKVFKRSIMLRRHHLYEHTREGKALFPCKGCGKKFKTLAHARRHDLYHNPMDARRKFSCEECQKLFCTKQDLDRHFDSVHSDSKPFKCRQCAYSTTRKFYLAQHEKTHGIISGRYMCVTCDKCFVSEPFFQAHLRDKHHQGVDINASDVQLMELSASEAEALVESENTSIMYTYAT